MKKFLGMSAFLLSLVVLASCGSDDDGPSEPEDSKNPTVTITKPSGSAVLEYGQKLLVSGSFADDIALKEVTFSLSSAATDAWAPEDITIAITTGKTFTLTDEDIYGVVIPDGKMGNYTLKTTVKDGKDKVATSSVDFTIEPVEAVAPTMTITKPIDNAQISRGAELLLSGTFVDDKALAKVVATLAAPVEPAGGASLKGLNVIPDPWAPAAFEVALSGMSQELTDQQLFGEIIPTTCKTGKYTLTLTLHDASGKTTEKTIVVEIM